MYKRQKVYFKKGCMPVALDELGTVMHKKKAFIVTDSFLYKNGYVKPIEEKQMCIRDRVTEDIDTLQAAGHVEIRGQEWSAKTDEPDGKIAKDTIVVVEGIQGVKLIVRERRKEEE